MTLKDKADLALKVATALIAAFGVWKYFDTQERAVLQEARSESLELVERYSSGEIVASRKTLIDFWLRHPVFTEFARMEGVSFRELKGFVHATMKEEVSSINFRSALFEMSNFYDEVWACRSAQICEPVLLDSALCGRAKTHVKYYSVFFNEFNALIGGGSFGANLRKYATKCRSPD